MDVVAHAYNPNTREAEARELQVQIPHWVALPLSRILCQCQNKRKPRDLAQSEGTGPIPSTAKKKRSRTKEQ